MYVFRYWCHPKTTNKKVLRLTVWDLVCELEKGTMRVSLTKRLFSFSKSCLRFCAIVLQISFLALVIASKKIQNCQ